MEFVLDGLHQNSKIAKDETNDSVSYKDMSGRMLKENPPQRGNRSAFNYEEEWNF
jgi:hypothetical protein